METVISSFPVTKLKTDNLQDVAMVYGQRRTQTRMQFFTSPLTAESTISYVSLLGLNREMPTPPPVSSYQLQPNQARIIIDDQSSDVQNPKVITTGFSTTNLTGGTFATLNQVVHPPEVAVPGFTYAGFTAANDALDTSVTLNFEALLPTKPLKQNPDIGYLQMFLVHVRDSIDIDRRPKMVVTLRQDGADVQTLTFHEYLEKTSEGFIFVYLWDPAVLNPVSTNVGLRIDGVAISGATVEPLAVHWFAEIETSALLYDSDWQDIPVGGDHLIWLPDLVVPEFGTRRILIELSDFSARQVGILTLDGNGDISDASIFDPLGPPLTVGRFAAGETRILPLHEQHGFNLRKVGNNQGALVPTYGGHLRAARIDLNRWEADLSVIMQSQTRLYAELEPMYNDVGSILPLLFIVDQNNHETALWAVINSFDLTGLGQLTGEDYPGAGSTTDQRFDLAIGLTEITPTKTGREV